MSHNDVASAVPGRLRVLALLILLIAEGCGGGSGSTAPAEAPPPPPAAPEPEPPPPEPATYRSLQFEPWCASCVDANAATVVIDGQPAVLGDLREGEPALMRGTRFALLDWSIVDQSLPVIEAVEVTTLLQGPVEAIDMDRGSLRVMGQPVQALRTAFDDPAPSSPASLAAFAPGDTVRVSGYRSAEGHILATRIDHADAASTLRIVGELIEGPDSLRIGVLSVDISNAIFDGLPGGPRAGDVVAVSGTLSGRTTLLADRLTAYDPIGTPEPGALISILGIGSEFSVPWYVQGKVALSELLFEDPYCDYEWEVANVGQLWRLQGLMRDDGLVDSLACSIGYFPGYARDFSPLAREIQGPVQAVDLALQSITVLGVTARLNRFTFLHKGGRLAYASTVTLDEIEVGQTVFLRGFAGADDASLLVSDGWVYDDTEIELMAYGTAPESSGPEFQIGSLSILTREGTEFVDLRGDVCEVITGESFFAALPAPTAVWFSDDEGDHVANHVDLYGSEEFSGRCDP